MFRYEDKIVKLNIVETIWDDVCCKMNGSTHVYIYIQLCNF